MCPSSRGPGNARWSGSASARRPWPARVRSTASSPASPSTPPRRRRRTRWRTPLAGADLVVVENLLTIPLNLPASRVVAAALRGRPALLHHHDPPWHRARFAHVTELPADDPAWRHVAISRLAAAELAERGIEPIVVYNAFELDDAAGAR